MSGPDEVVWVRIEDLRWSQTTCGNRVKTPEIIRGFEEAGGKWVPEKGTIDAVRTSEGLVTLDHTRLRVAERFGIDRVTVRVHNADDLLPSSPPYPTNMGPRRLRSFRRAAAKSGVPSPQTWGDLVRIRCARNGLDPTGTAIPPKLRGVK